MREWVREREREMDSDQGKLFIGGISWDTNEDKLKEHFGNYGDVLSTSVMREKNTGKPRGFGFVVFADPSILDRVLEDKHVIDGRTVIASSHFFNFWDIIVFLLLPFPLNVPPYPFCPMLEGPFGELVFLPFIFEGVFFFFKKIGFANF